MGDVYMQRGRADAFNESHFPSCRRSDEPGALVFVWGCWAVMVALAIFYVARYGCEIPILDELDYVDVLVGDKPMTAKWLWAFHNEDRIVIPKLIQAFVLRLTAANFRVTTYLGVTLLALSAGAMMVASRKLRGAAAYSDALFPILLLHWGHFHTFWSGFQVQFVTSCCLALVLLLIIVRQPGVPGPRASLVAGACLVALPLCGAQGLLIVPPLAVWLGGCALVPWLAARRQETASQPWRAAFEAIPGLALAATAGMVIAACVQGYRKMGHHPAGAGLLAAARTTAEFMAANLGPTGGSLWPISAVIVVGSVLLALIPLGLVIRRQPAERARAFGMLLFFCSCCLLSLAVGLGRSGYGPGAGAESRYAIMATPLLCWASFSWLLYGGGTAARPAQLGLAAMMLAVVIPNATVARERGRANLAYFAGIERDIRGGMTVDEFVDRYTGIYLHERPQERNREIVAALGRQRVGMFKWLRAVEGKPSRLPVAFTLAATNAMTWEANAGQSLGADPYVVFAMGETRSVEAIEVTCTVTAADPAVSLGFYWTDSAEGGFDVSRHVMQQVVSGTTSTLRIPIGGSAIDYFRIDLEGGATALQVGEISAFGPSARQPAGEPQPTDGP